MRRPIPSPWCSPATTTSQSKARNTLSLVAQPKPTSPEPPPDAHDLLAVVQQLCQLGAAASRGPGAVSIEHALEGSQTPPQPHGQGAVLDQAGSPAVRWLGALAGRVQRTGRFGEPADTRACRDPALINEESPVRFA